MLFSMAVDIAFKEALELFVGIVPVAERLSRWELKGMNKKGREGERRGLKKEKIG